MFDCSIEIILVVIKPANTPTMIFNKKTKRWAVAHWTLYCGAKNEDTKKNWYTSRNFLSLDFTTQDF